MNLLTRLRQGPTEQRYSFDEYISQVNEFSFGGLGYQPSVQTTYNNRPAEGPDGSFEGRVQGAYKNNGVIFACQVARMMLFTEARFMFQSLKAGRPGDLFWKQDLLILESPWFNGSTGDLLSKMLQDVDMAGNAFVRRTGPLGQQALERLRPDWTTIILGADSDFVTPQVVGYGYQPGGMGSKEKVRFFDRTEVAHWAPIPDPTATYRGMSWLTPILREIRSDTAATDHKNLFFEHAATPNMVINFDSTVAQEWLEKFKKELESEHAGWRNAYKTLYLRGATASQVGLNFEQMDFKAVQGAGETRIAAAAGVPPVIVGLSEGLQAATYSNYGQARRRFADMTARPLWRSCCASISTIVPAPGGARLWYDDRDIPALQEDQKDAADIQKVNVEAIAALVHDGFDPDSAVKAIQSQDLSLLEHTGLLSVQLQTPGTQDTPADPADPASPPPSQDVNP